MERKEQRTEHVVFGLDLGTRSVVGTVGYMQGGHFYCIAQRLKEHETRSMLDGQIHDIGKVANTIRQVKNELEIATNIELTDVCIAAAGRVLKTIQTRYEMEFPDGHTMTDEDVYHLESGAVEKAYAEFLKRQEGDFLKYYLVGYSTMHYYLNDYMIANLEGHDAGRVAVDLIATFLPDDVVDGLYKACERAGLQVVNLTLEPIAAIEVAIPEKFRMLNLALIDVGAGTSDICITDDGTIVAYGMLPVAGDHLTEVIAKHCLVDFNTGDRIKIAASREEEVSYVDIMGLDKTITGKEILEVLQPTIQSMADQVTTEIRRLNGDRPVSAIFIVGGGGKIAGYAEAVAKSMDLPEERVALRGEEVMKEIVFMSKDGIERDSRMVTPLGICMSYYASNNNFVFVNFNGEQIKLYDNGRLAVGDVAMQVDFPNEDLFPKRGKDLVFTINGKERIIRGKPGESAEILLNGQPADIHTRLHGNDIIEVRRSTTGPAAQIDIEALPEFKKNFKVNVNGQDVKASRVAEVNGHLQSGFYGIHSGDDVRILDYDTAEQIAALLDIEITPDTVIIVNNEIATRDTPVYENFKVEFKKQEDTILEYYHNYPGAEDTEASEDGPSDADRYEEERPWAYQASGPVYAGREQMGQGTGPLPNLQQSYQGTGPLPNLQQMNQGTGPLPHMQQSYQGTGPLPNLQQMNQGTGPLPHMQQNYQGTGPLPNLQQAHQRTGPLPNPQHSRQAPGGRQQARTAAGGMREIRRRQPEGQMGLFDEDYMALQQAAVEAGVLSEMPSQDAEETERPALHVDLHVIINGRPVTMTGKSEYIFVDIFDYIDFDLKESGGRAIVTQVNGASPDYMQALAPGDRIEVYWKEE